MDTLTDSLEYMIDIAEREAINRYTTAEIHVDMTNNNNISGTNDIDGIVDALDKWGITPIFKACYWCDINVELVKLLLEYGANVNIVSEDGETPLFYACQNDNIELVKLLLGYGANVNVVSEDGETPLFYACQNGNIELVKLLLEHRTRQ